jgi:acetyl esterase/lipase
VSGNLAADEKQAHPQATIENRKDQVAYLDLEFARVGDLPILMDLYVPTHTGRKPHVVVFFHGGSWMKGSKKTCHVHWLTQHGYAVASIGYRLTTVAPFPAQIHDGKGAVRFLRANADTYGIDGGNIGSSGASAGGHLGLLLATSGDVKELEGEVGGNLDQSSRVQAGLGLFCPADLLYDAVENKARFDHPGSPIYRLLGCKPSENLEKARMASATGHVSRDDPPIMMLAGGADKDEPKIHGKRMKAAYDEAGLDATFQLVEGAGHGGPQYRDAKRRKLILEMFDRSLRGK